MDNAGFKPGDAVTLYRSGHPYHGVVLYTARGWVVCDFTWPHTAAKWQEGVKPESLVRRG